MRGLIKSEPDLIESKERSPCREWRYGDDIEESDGS